MLAFTGGDLLAGLRAGRPGARLACAARQSESRGSRRRAPAATGGSARVLVIAQLSISMVLLVGATLFVGTLVKLYGVDRGLRTDGVLDVQRSLQPTLSAGAELGRPGRAARAPARTAGRDVGQRRHSCADRRRPMDARQSRWKATRSGPMRARTSRSTWSRPSIFATVGTPL